MSEPRGIRREGDQRIFLTATIIWDCTHGHLNQLVRTLNACDIFTLTYSDRVEVEGNNGPGDLESDRQVSLPPLDGDIDQHVTIWDSLMGWFQNEVNPG